jgi:hypothetical protein
MIERQREREREPASQKSGGMSSNSLPFEDSEALKFTAFRVRYSSSIGS